MGRQGTRQGRTLWHRTARAARRSLAAAQTVTKKPSAVLPLHARLDDNAAALLAAYRTSAAELDSGRDVVPAAEWLLDNYHLVEEQIREIVTICHLATIVSCRNCPMGRLPVIRECSDLHGHSLRIRTAISILRDYGASSTPISESNPSRSGNYGPSRSRCASCWWKTFAGWRTRSLRGVMRARMPKR